MYDSKNFIIIDQKQEETIHSDPVCSPNEDRSNELINALNNNMLTSENIISTNEEKEYCSSLLHSCSAGSKIKVSEEINKITKHLANSYKSIGPDSSYENLIQYYGIVEQIDNCSNKFTATLTNVENETDQLSADFDFDDLQYISDRELIGIGANLVWLIGKEKRTNGMQINISKFVLRRTRVLSHKKIEEAERKANDWTAFFQSIKNNDCSE